MIKLSETEFNRLKAFGREVWDGLTIKEKRAFYDDTGVRGFLENVAELLHIKLAVLDEPAIDELLADILESKEMITKKVYGEYIPDADITIIFEQTVNRKTNKGTLELKGFYYGEPNCIEIKWFYNDMVAEFDVDVLPAEDK